MAGQFSAAYSDSGPGLSGAEGGGSESASGQQSKCQVLLVTDTDTEAVGR